MPKLTDALPRAVQLGLFRLHLDNGLSVCAGLTLVGLGFGLTMGFLAAVAATTGSLCISVMDQPDPLRHKPWVLGSAILPAAVATLLAVLGWKSPYVMIASAAAIGLWTGLISVYGKRAIGLGMSTILAFVFGLGTQAANLSDALKHEALFVGGGLVYAAYAQTAAFIMDRRTRRLLLAETLRALAVYMRAKATLYDPAVPAGMGLAGLIEAQADLADRLQAARDGLYLHAHSPAHFRQTEILIALLDAFEVALSGDADVEAIRGSARAELTLRIRTLILAMANDVEAMVAAAGGGRSIDRFAAEDRARHDLAKDIDGLIRNADPTDTIEDLAAFRSTVNKIGHAEAALKRLQTALDPTAPLTGVGARLDLAPFAQDSRITLATLRSQFTLHAPAMRYAIRLSSALTVGMILTLALPHYIHGGWVLLTTALIMRANFSVTRRRRRDRLIGTLGGCVLAVGLINYAPPMLLLPAIILTIGVSHAYAVVNYKITALSASVTALLLLHIMAPHTHPLFLERLGDTLVGAGLSYGFSFLLPSWARDGLPAALTGLLGADRAFASQALAREPLDQAYRLARKQALDSGLALVRLTRDLAGEPGSRAETLTALNDLLAANYLFLSDLASVQVLMRNRPGQLTPETADAWIAEARGVVTGMLSNLDAPPAPRTGLKRRGLGRMQTDDAMTALGRRLAHVERGAANLARLAATAA